MSARTNEYGQPIGEPVPGWTPRARPGDAPIDGRYCRIERLDAARHADALFDAYRAAPDGRDWTYLFSEPPVDRDAFRARTEASAATADPLHHAIVDARSGSAIGTSALMRIDPAMGTIEVGHVAYSPSLQRTPAATEAQYLLMRRAFDELGYRRYEWKCDALNAPSRAAALRYGFTFEGVFRNAVVYKGRSRDTAWFSIIDSDWSRVRSAFEAWLDPSNFDADGRQRRTLAALREGVAAHG